ncbi:HlyD family secretion protein [Pseudokordiimonas caeni]|uniref:HlyD family secretion protein n=1 Tax=Pseudokordiimonas caeni TaxID=2997908 RepID=UPI002811264D|nr:HlyD family secretion protein [Pseudokordiimonas caeni]
MSETTEIPADAPAPKKSRRGLLAALAMAGTALAGAAWIALPGAYEATDDAYVEVDASLIAPRVRGFISKVLVEENRPVKAGDPLFEIDPEEFEARLADARANVGDAIAVEAAAQAALASLDAEEQLAGAEVIATRTAVRATEAEFDRANAEHGRYAKLVAAGWASHSRMDSATAEAVTAEQNVAKAKALLGVAREKVRVVQTKRASLEAALAKAQAQVKKAEAAVDLARQDLDHTVIYAPADGVAANRHGNIGDYVQPGSRLLTVVPVRESYVTAYFKETQIERMKPGQKVEIEIDALSGTPIEGYVDSLAPGSGSQFALLPFEPGSGNFTKIVQRIPVRIRFASAETIDSRNIRPGLSANVEVHVAK